MDCILKYDTTSEMIEVFLRSSTTGQGKTGLLHSDMTIKYMRQGDTALASVSPVTSTLGTWTSGGFKEVGLGWYQFGIPNAAIAYGDQGAKVVRFLFSSSSTIDKEVKIALVPWNPNIDTDLGLSTITAIYGGLLTQQNIRDAMKLAPTAGDPATGSIDKHLDDIPTTSTLTQQNVRDAMKLAPSSGDPVAGSIDDHLDDIQSKTDTIGSASFTLTSPVGASGDIELYAGDDYDSARPVSFTITDWSGPNVNTKTGKFRVLARSKYEQDTKTADVEISVTYAQSGTTVTTTVVLTPANMAGLSTVPPQCDYNYKYQLQVTVGTKTYTLCEGNATVKKTIAAVAT